MLLAPHPDDESLACSVLLQRAVRAGGSVRVIYATNGENNPWPQRALERKWRLDQSHRLRWGELRQKEALTALALLGVSGPDVEFLGLPDQDLTGLLLSECQQTLRELKDRIEEWAPTDILVPDISDTHPDHSALGLMLRLVFNRLSGNNPRLCVWNFLVHGNSIQFSARAAALPQTRQETAIKIATIACHQSQLKLSRRRFMAYAGRPEHFVVCNTGERNAFEQASNAWRHSGEFVITVPVARKRLLAPSAKMLLLGYDPSGQPLCTWIRIDPRAAALEMFHCRTGEHLGKVQFERSSSAELRIALPRNTFAFDRSVYVKVARWRIFFDQAGWIEARDYTGPAQSADTEVAGELSLALS
jgi:LmbE family N-acetylglucosaminyl deacetylase